MPSDLRILDLSGSPRAVGRAHGESLRAEITALADERLRLVSARVPTRSLEWLDALALRHRAPLEAFDRACAEELDGIAEGSGVPWPRILILNAYTDFRDVAASPAADHDGCTALWAPASETGGDGPLLAQTWDMHPSAEAFVCALRVHVDDAPPAVVFTVAGCVGMAGMNAHGLGIAINNLTPTDARVGVAWPSLVRRVLRERNVEGAVRVFDGSPLASGHNYLLADATGVAVDIETTGRTHRVLKLDTVYSHTNHYLDATLRPLEAPPKAGSTTYERLDLARRKTQDRTGPLDVGALELLLGDHERFPRSLCSHLADLEPDMSKTCGALVCNLQSRSMRAVRGCAAVGRWETLTPA